MFHHLTFTWLSMEHLSLLLDNPVRLALCPHLQVRRPRQLLVQSIFLPSQLPLGLGGPLPGTALTPLYLIAHWSSPSLRILQFTSVLDLEWVGLRFHISPGCTHVLQSLEIGNREAEWPFGFTEGNVPSILSLFNSSALLGCEPGIFFFIF